MNTATNNTASDRATVIAFEETELSSFSPEYKALKIAAAHASARLAITDAVRSAYLAITAGRTGRYVTLAALRAALQGEDRASVDAALRGMQSQGEAVLYPIDDPQRATAADLAASMLVSGERRDLLCLTA